VQNDAAVLDDLTVIAQRHGRLRILLDQEDGQALLAIDGRDGSDPVNPHFP
jgi:hypothetical protein